MDTSKPFRMDYSVDCHMCNTGIYKITNLTNGNIYVGSAASKSGFKGRWGCHICGLNKNKHHARHLQSAWNKYGSTNFRFEIIELVEDLNNIIEREQFYIDSLKPIYNTCQIAGSSLGVKCNEEVRRKISISMKGKMAGKRNPMYKTNSYNKWLDKFGVVEANKLNILKSERLSKSHTNKIQTDETKKKISSANKGENSGVAKLTQLEADEIRVFQKNNTNINFSKLGKMYNVGGWVIYSIIKNISYKNDSYEYGDIIKEKKLIGDTIRNKYNNEKISGRELSEIYNISQTQIRRIINNKIYN